MCAVSCWSVRRVSLKLWIFCFAFISKNVFFISFDILRHKVILYWSKELLNYLHIMVSSCIPQVIIFSHRTFFSHEISQVILTCYKLILWNNGWSQTLLLNNNNNTNNCKKSVKSNQSYLKCRSLMCIKMKWAMSKVLRISAGLCSNFRTVAKQNQTKPNVHVDHMINPKKNFPHHVSSKRSS